MYSTYYEKKVKGFDKQVWSVAGRNMVTSDETFEFVVWNSFTKRRLLSVMIKLQLLPSLVRLKQLEQVSNVTLHDVSFVNLPSQRHWRSLQTCLNLNVTIQSDCTEITNAKQKRNVSQTSWYFHSDLRWDTVNRVIPTLDCRNKEKIFFFLYQLNRETFATQQKGNWDEWTFAKTSGTVTRTGQPRYQSFSRPIF